MGAERWDLPSDKTIPCPECGADMIEFDQLVEDGLYSLGMRVLTKTARDSGLTKKPIRIIWDEGEIWKRVAD